MNVHLKAAIPPVTEFDFLCPPNLFESVRGFAPRLRFALLQLVNCPLGQANAQPEFGLAPAEHGPR